MHTSLAMTANQRHNLVAAATLSSLGAQEKSASPHTGQVIASLWPPSDGTVSNGEALARVLAVGALTDE